MSRQKTLENAKRHLDKSNFRRAKEILQGNMSSHGYNPEIFECYGQVLLRMGDNIEAGKYLFLSGVRKGEYDDAIDLYLRRFKKTSLADLHSNFPSSVRRLPLKKLPSVVIEKLREKGFTDRQISDTLEDKNVEGASWHSKLILGGCLLFVVATLIIFGIGVNTIASGLT